MYSEAELDAAVRAGVLPAQTAAAFREFVARGHAAPGVDEEHFRLLTGFNDIFVTIAAALILMAIAWLGGRQAVWLGGALVAAASWGLAEYFTRKRRMGLPSILLLLSFVGACIATVGGVVLPQRHGIGPQGLPALLGAVCVATGAAAAFVHWRRFMVPITVAAGAASALGAGVLLLASAFPDSQDLPRVLTFVAGICMFGLAMWWDASDRQRITRRADVAFWLHLAAAPMIVHPAFGLLGLLGHGTPAAAAAVVAVGIYVALAAVALAVDRRALLVSALAYVLVALSALLNGPGAISTGLPVAALLIGSCLLLLSALWQRIRRVTVLALPAGLQLSLPPV